MATCFGLGLLISVLALFVHVSESAVCSIDLGSEWLKVAVVNLKPGQSPISIAINEMSKRKSPALVAFHSVNRLLGEEAAGLVARYPEKVYSQVRDALGKPLSHLKRLYDSLYLPYDLVENSRGSTGFRITESEEVYSAEELLAMILGHAMQLAQFHSKVAIKDAVITVPPFFGHAERKALLSAADLAGISVLSLVNEYTGAALQYGIDKDFSNGSRNVIFYDMGASNVYAALVHFSSYNTKEYGSKSVSVNQFQVKDVRWDSGLGGLTMESRLMEHFADEFNKKIGEGIDIRKSPKAMAKLRKQVKRTKEILSANTVSPVSVESIYGDYDLRSTIMRSEFEELCRDLWERALVPIEQLLEHSGLKLDDISAVELIGGATRVPKIQAVISEFLGRKDLDRHLDADEAIVLGAALHAANLSDGIKLNRKFGMIDGSTYAVQLGFHGPDLEKQLLVPRMKKLPSKISRSIIHDEDFQVTLSYDDDEYPLPPGLLSPIIARYSISGLSEVKGKYLGRNMSAPVKVNLHASLSRSGVVSLDRAEAVVEVTEWVEVDDYHNIPKKANSSTAGDSPLLPPPPEVNGTDDATTVEKKLKKRTFRIGLKVAEVRDGEEEEEAAEVHERRLRLAALDKKDLERRRTAEMKNNLEAYVYSTKEKLASSEEDLKQVVTDEDRQIFTRRLDEVEEWLYMDGEDGNATEFEEKLDGLKAHGDPIFLRLAELEARPAALKYGRQYLDDEFQKVLHSWASRKPWLPTHDVSRRASDTRTWLFQKENEQAETSPFERPVFTSAEVYQRVSDLQKQVAAVDRIPEPKPSKPAKNGTATDSGANSTDASVSSQDGDGDASSSASHDEL